MFGIAVLVLIYFHRYQIVQTGASPLQIFTKRKKNFLLEFPSWRNEKSEFEVTIDELIPSSDTVDPKIITKAQILANKADHFLQKGDLINAEKLLIQALALNPSNPDYYHKLGLIYLKQNQYSKSEMMYRKLTVSGFQEASYLSNLGMALYQQKKLEEAKSFYQQAIATDPTRPGRFFSLGQIFYELQDFEKALENFEKALDLDQKNIDYLLTLANFYLERDMKEKARELLEEIVAKYPKNEDAQEMLKSIDTSSPK